MSSNYQCLRNYHLYPRHIAVQEYNNYQPTVATCKTTTAQNYWVRDGKPSHRGLFMRPNYRMTPRPCYYKYEVYSPKCPNPFIPSGGACEWSRNELLLQDKELRYKSGVSILDNDITDVYSFNPQSSSL